jgi:hypothetical protein
MRGSDTVVGLLFSYVDLEKRVRADHPLRVIRGIVNAALAEVAALVAAGTPRRRAVGIVARRRAPSEGVDAASVGRRLRRKLRASRG